MPAALRLAFEILGRLVSTAVLGVSILRGGGNPLLFLWGLWIEEVLTLAGLSVRQAILRRPGLRGPYVAFPAIHLVFVAAFTAAGVTGLFSGPSAPLLPPPTIGSVLALAGVLAFWTTADTARALLLRGVPGEDAREAGRVERKAWFALFLPHVTIIAAGFCLVMLRLGNWIAGGILGGKVLFEMLSFALARGGARRPPQESRGSPQAGSRGAA